MLLLKNKILNRDSLINLLLFFVILFLPTQLGRHFWLRDSYIFSLKIDYLAAILYFWDLLLIALICIDFKSIKKRPLFIFLVFFLSQTLSLFKAINLMGGFFRLEQIFLCGLFGVYLASLNLKRIEKPLVWGLIIGVSGESLIAILQFINSSSLGLWLLGERTFNLSTLSIATFNWYGQVFLRPYATFPHPNLMAAYMVIAVPLIFYFLKNYYLKITVFMLAFIAVILSFSRSVISILVIESLFLVKNNRKYLYVLFLLLSPLLIIRFWSALNFDSLSLTRREDLIEIGMEMFYKAPFLGVGVNNFLNNVATSDLISGPNRFLQPIHNIYILTLTETGIVGFVGLLLFMGSSLRRSISQFNNGFNRLLFFLMVIIIILGLFDHYFLTLASGQRLLFLIWGLSMIEFKND